MNVKKGECKLCNSVEVVVFDEKIKEDIQNAFLVKEKWKSIQDMKEFFICPTCIFKVHLSSKIHKNFKKSKKKTRKLKQCFFCDSIGDRLLFLTGDNPSNFKKHFIQFVESIGSNERIEEVFDKLICSECLFGFVVWGKLQKQVFTFLNLSHNNNDEEQYEDSELAEESKRLRMLKPRSSGDELKRSLNARLFQQKHRKKRNQFGSLKKLLSQKKIKVKVNNDIKKDDKMYSKVPYVKMGRCVEFNNEETCCISDDDDLITPRLSPIVSSINRTNSRPHLCNICDKSFQLKCDYLSHILNHDKFENLIINVARLDLNNLTKMNNDFNKIAVKYLGDSQPSTSKFDTRRSHLNSETSSSSDKKVFKFKINPNKKKLQLKTNVEEEEETDVEINLLSDDINKNKKDDFNEEDKINENEQDELESLRLDNDGNNEIDSSKVEISFHGEENLKQNDEVIETIPAISSLTVEVGGEQSSDEHQNDSDEEGSNSSRIQSQLQEQIPTEINSEEKNNETDDNIKSNQSPIQIECSEETDFEKEMHEKDSNSLRNQSPLEDNEDFSNNDCIIEENIPAETSKRKLSTEDEQIESLSTENSKSEEFLKTVDESQNEPNSLEKNQESQKSISTLAENSDLDETFLNESPEIIETKTKSDKDLKGDHELNEMEVVTFDDLKNLGETVVWVNDESGKDDSVGSTEQTKEEKENVEQEKNVDDEDEENDDELEEETDEHNEDTQLKNAPIMTNEDLLNILEESASEKVEEEESMKRKRAYSESGDDFSSNGDNQTPRTLNKRVSQNYRIHKRGKSCLINTDNSKGETSTSKAQSPTLSDGDSIRIEFKDTSSSNSESNESIHRLKRKYQTRPRSSAQKIQIGDAEKENSSNDEVNQKNKKIDEDEEWLVSDSKEESSSASIEETFTDDLDKMISTTDDLECFESEQSSSSQFTKRNYRTRSRIRISHSSNRTDEELRAKRSKSKQDFSESSSKEESSSKDSSWEEISSSSEGFLSEEFEIRSAKEIRTRKTKLSVLDDEISSRDESSESELLTDSSSSNQRVLTKDSDEAKSSNQSKKRIYRTRTRMILQKSQNAQNNNENYSNDGDNLMNSKAIDEINELLAKESFASSTQSELSNNGESQILIHSNIILSTAQSAQKSNPKTSKLEQRNIESDDDEFVVNDSSNDNSSSVESSQEPTTSDSKIVSTSYDSNRSRNTKYRTRSQLDPTAQENSSNEEDTLRKSTSKRTSDHLQSKKRKFKKIYLRDDDSNSREDSPPTNVKWIDTRINNQKIFSVNDDTENASQPNEIEINVEVNQFGHVLDEDKNATLESDDDVIEVALSPEKIVILSDSNSNLSDCSTELLDNISILREFETDTPSPPLITEVQ
ncbi:dentin sialophosphoprotein-like [Onthophagus taurus]|uniref:dentin sialophosphoprotein-like n=1 Tax=Onthophagus taurus TaxID=166361 RepID=UPI0039BDCDB2